MWESFLVILASAKIWKFLTTGPDLRPPDCFFLKCYSDTSVFYSLSLIQCSHLFPVKYPKSQLTKVCVCMFSLDTKVLHICICYKVLW